MCHSLSEGENVKISGFGSFILRDKGERVGRNPKTGVEVPIAPAPGPHLPRQPDHARADRQGRLNPWRSPPARANRLSAQSANSPTI
jgi:hypothetical protein